MHPQQYLTMNNGDMLSVKEVSRTLNVSRATVWRWVAEGHLNPPIKIGPNTTRWRAADIGEFIASRAAA